MSVSSSKSPFDTPSSTPPNTPSGRTTPCSPTSILAADQGISNTWRMVVKEPQPPNTPKSVQFNKSVKVVLIPTRDEYIEASLTSSMFWDRSEIAAFKTSSRTEVSAFKDLHNIGSTKTAIHMLYQPDPSDLA